MPRKPKPLTPAQEREFMRALGRRGGKASLKSMTPEARKERARKAIAARWERERAKAQEEAPDGDSD